MPVEVDGRKFLLLKKTVHSLKGGKDED